MIFGEVMLCDFPNCKYKTDNKNNKEWVIFGKYTYCKLHKHWGSNKVKIKRNLYDNKSTK
jgi:hypothetical protein